MNYGCSFFDGYSYEQEGCNRQCIASDGCSVVSSDGPKDSDQEKHLRSKRSEEKGPKRELITEMHLKALEDLVNVNSLFLIAVFIGLSTSSQDQPRLGNRQRCDPDAAMAKTLVMYEVLSFGFFLLSSLAAKSLKVLLNIFLLEEETNPSDPVKYYFSSLKPLFQSIKWRQTILLTSTVSSVVGVVFLTLSMFNLIQIKLGMFSCGSFRTSISVLSLTGLVLVSLTLYLSTMLFSTFVRFRKDFRTILKKQPEPE